MTQSLINMRMTEVCRSRSTGVDSGRS